jgi:LacI family transcriptional regulator
MNAEDLLVDIMLERIIEIASDQDFYVLARIIRDTTKDTHQVKIREMFTQRRIDGGIFIGFPNHFALIEELIAEGHVVGILDQCIPGRNEPNRIIVNFDDNTMALAVEYLFSMGHRNFITVLGDSRRYNGAQKESAFRRAMKNLGLQVRKDWILYGRFERLQAKSEMNRFLLQSADSGKKADAKHAGQRPTAILCCNDDMSFGILDALHENGLRVPDDYSLISIDDSYMSRYTTPPLTTFHVDFEEMLRKLTESVIAFILQPSADHRVFEFPSEIVERESCRRLMRQAGDLGSKNVSQAALQGKNRETT